MNKPKKTEETARPEGERIAKVMAGAGLCSRREAEAWIGEGRVMLDGETVTTPATFVLPGQKLQVNGKAVSLAKTPTRFWLYHKPPGLVTTHRDELDRQTVFDTLPEDMPRVVSVGRLDLNSEGLLLLTTSGALERYLELPFTAWVRRYRVRIDGMPNAEAIAKLERGMTVDGVRYGPIQLQPEASRETRNQWVLISLQEGKNREIRRVMEALGFHVSRLIRLSYGPFQLGNLPRGQLREIPMRTLKEQLGKDAPL